MPSNNLSIVGGYADAAHLVRRRSGYLGESFPLDDCSGIIQPSSGVLYLTSLLLMKDVDVTNLVFKTGTTAGTGTTNFWFGLWSHMTAAAPPIPANETLSLQRTSGSATLTLASGTLTNKWVGRTVTGTGIPGSTRIIAMPSSTTLTMSANASSGSATTTTCTFGQYVGPRANVAVTADTTTTVNPAANTYITKALTFPFKPPTTGLYLAGVLHAHSGGTQPNWVGKVLPAACGDATINHIAASNAGPHTTPPGAANPLASQTDVLNWMWCGYT